MTKAATRGNSCKKKDCGMSIKAWMAIHGSSSMMQEADVQLRSTDMRCI